MMLSIPEPKSSDLNPSYKGIEVYHALRDAKGIITDFRLAMINAPALRLWGRLQAELQGFTLSQLFTGYEATYLITQFCLVVESGRTVRFQMNYPEPLANTKEEVELLVVRINEGVMVSYEELIDQNQPNRQVEQQTSLLESVLNSTTIGVANIVAVRNILTQQIDDFRFGQVNQLTAQVLQTPREQIEGNLLSKVYPEYKTRLLFAEYVTVIETGQPHQQQRYLPEFNRWFDSTVSKHGDGVVIIFNDITPQKQAELEARQQAGLLENIQHSSQNAIAAYKAIRDEAGKIIDFKPHFRNQRATQLSGQSLDLTQTLLEFMPTLRDTHFFQTYIRVAETGVSEQSEEYYKVGDIEGWFNVTISPWSDGFISQVIDATLLRKAEQEKLQKGAYYKAVLDTTLASVTAFEAVRDKAGSLINFRCTLANQQVLREAKLDESAVLGQLITDIVPGVVESGLFSRYIAIVETQQAQQYELHYPLNGENAWYLGSAAPYGDGLIASYTIITKQKQAELQAWHHADLLENIQNTSQTAIAAYKSIRNAEGTIVDFKPVFRNRASARLSRQPLEVGEATLLDIVPDIKTTELFDRYMRVAETGVGEQVEQYYNAHDVEGWFNLSIQPWGDGFVTNILDTTELRKAEREKLQQTELLQAVIDNIQSGIVLYEIIRDKASGEVIDFRFSLTNPANEQVIGRPAAEIMYHSIYEVFPDLMQSVWGDYLFACAHTGEQQTFLFPYFNEGINGWFDVAFVRHEPYVLFTFVDVTALKEAELRQQQNAELLQQVMNTTPVAIVVHESIRDETGAIIDFRMTQLNQEAADLLQKPIEKIQHRRISQYFPELQGTTLLSQYIDVVQTGQPFRTDVSLSGRWYYFSVARFGDGLIVAAQDVTPMREYRQQLEVTNIELQRSNENLESFAYVASHDLQEPLRKIVTFASILQSQYSDQFDTNSADLIRRMNGAAERMRLMIQDILAYSRIKTAQHSYKRIDLSKIIDDLKENDLWAMFYQRKAQLHLHNLPTLLADPLQMHQLFQNLLSNAVKFCLPGVVPDITVSCRVIERSMVPANLLLPALTGKSNPENQSYYDISVADNGIGFEEKHAHRIFQVFQRLHGKSKYAGSGIGLAICQKIVERHEGAITASSQPGKGSTFSVYLPVRGAVDE